MEEEQEEEEELRYLLEDEERGEGPGDVQLYEVKAGLPVSQRGPLWHTHTHARPHTHTPTMRQQFPWRYPLPKSSIMHSVCLPPGGAPERLTALTVID